MKTPTETAPSADGTALKTAPESEGTRVRPEIRHGLIVWIVFCLAAVALRGVRWDEQYEFAQVVTHSIGYPEHHPYLYCTRNALNLQIYATSALYWLCPSPGVVNGFRNVLYLMATVIPVYLLGSILSRRALWGHAAAILILMGIHEEFDACYQMFAWPSYGSTGHFGLGYALATLALFLNGCAPIGAFLLGLMPCVHIGQMPILLLFSLLFFADQWRRKGTRRLLPLLVWAAAGFAVCVFVWANKASVQIPLPTSGPYYSNADPQRVWAGYVSQDSLRALPGRPTDYTNSFILLAMALLLAGCAAFLETRSTAHEAARPWAWLCVYLFSVGAAVWGVMAIHYLLGTRVPFVFISWMPYRFANHAAYILLALLPALLAAEGCRNAACSNAGRTVLACVFAFAAVRPLIGHLLPATIYARYAAGGEGILFFLCGSALASVVLRLETGQSFRKALVIVSLALVFILAMFHQFGAFCAVLGFGALTFLQFARPPQWASSRATVWVTLVAALACLTVQQALNRQHLPMTDFDRQVVQLLKDRGEPDAMLLARPEQYTLQAKTAHPVMADTCLAPWIPYMPTIGPAIQKIHRDFYGQTFELDDSGQAVMTRPWSEIWRERSVEEWQRLGREYDLHYIISPNIVPLSVTPLVKGNADTLYEIP